MEYRPDPELLKTVEKALPTAKRYPVSSYRLQFNRDFTFRDAARLVAYLHELGITDCYASPYFKARSGSQHGYDITDHNELNPEIGTAEDYHRFVRRLKRYGMGQILDFVPNHADIFDNARWQDVLENGRASAYSSFFDIDWNPVKTELRGKVLLPILEDFYGRVLEAGGLALDFGWGAFFISYQGNLLPLDPGTFVIILEPCLARLRETMGTDHKDYLELASIVTACRNLPSREEIELQKASHRRQEIAVIKRRLAELYRRNEMVRQAIDDSVASFNGTPGDSAGFGRLHQLLEEQAYRLSYWRVAAEEINYRRFFDINDLVALRVEDPAVFAETHRLVQRLLRDDSVTGVRIDHADGLFDPAGYLWRLQKASWLSLILEKLPHGPLTSEAEAEALRDELSQVFDRWRLTQPAAPSTRPLYLIVEKILATRENLPKSWPVDGTTGYDFMAALNQLFVDRRRRRAVLDTYRWFTRQITEFSNIVYQSKQLVMKTTMSSEVNMLAYQLNRISERSWQYRDFTLNSLRDAIREIISCFPVYRTYINAYQGTIDECDKATITAATLDAKRRNPAMSPAIFDFVRDTLLLHYPPGMNEEGYAEQHIFVMRFQQFTGPVMAKGMEDTAFYIYNPLISLNEVGDNPERFGASVDEFHRQNLLRHQTMPHSLMATSTHDSKRSEDVRARVNVLSEVPGEWRACLASWSRLNRSKKTNIKGELAPDRNDEYLIYQTLLGTYSVSKVSRRERTNYGERIATYLVKALREAKVHSSWISPDTDYEAAVTRFITDILTPASNNQFLAGFEKFNSLVANCGIYNSLSQTVLKLLSPGVPDTYQGNELLVFNLTDPDNRRPVDYKHYTNCLRRMKRQMRSIDDLPGWLHQLMRASHDGRIKMYLTWRALNFRRENVALFTDGAYMPLKAQGARKNRICSFAWKLGKQALIVTVPRLVAGLVSSSTVFPADVEVWGETTIVLPRKLRSGCYRDIFTGELKRCVPGTGLQLADLFRTLPLSVLETRTCESLQGDIPFLPGLD